MKDINMAIGTVLQKASVLVTVSYFYYSLLFTIGFAEISWAQNYSKMERTDNDKRTSLLHRSFHYESKTIYSSDTFLFLFRYH